MYQRINTYNRLCLTTDNPVAFRFRVKLREVGVFLSYTEMFKCFVYKLTLCFGSQEFIKLAKELKDSPSLRTHLTTNAKQYVCEHHSSENERETYKWLVEKLVSLQH